MKVPNLDQASLKINCFHFDFQDLQEVFEEDLIANEVIYNLSIINEPNESEFDMENFFSKQENSYAHLIYT